MIVYSSTAANFLEHVRSNTIHQRIRDQLKQRVGHKVAENEVASWRNSMQFVSHVVADRRIPLDATVAIEFKIPLTSRRVDFILCGKTDSGRDAAVIVELKQWSGVEASQKDAIVRTRLGGGLVETAHPSYQAWSYAQLILDFNETVRIEQIGIHPCAYLHNLDDPSVIRSDRYQRYTVQAPVFISSDSEKLRDFLAQHIRFGDADDVMYRIERGRIRPSKSLADALGSMLLGNPEFVMVDEQKLVFETALALSDVARNGKKQVLLVRGGPGTGKSVVAIRLLAELTERGLLTQYVSRNSAPREVYAAKLSGSMKKGRVSNLFKGSGTYIDTPPDTFDTLLVDEAHRLNEKTGMFKKGENQIKEIIQASRCSVFFIDESQRVTWLDIGSAEEIERWANKADAQFSVLDLPSQFRCNGSDGYVAFLDNALQIRETANNQIAADEYDFRVYDDPVQLHDEIRARNAVDNRARMVAGYCWPWISKKDGRGVDIEMTQFGYSAQWNLGADGMLWVISPDSVEQVGCVHTSQGLEVDYVGVIIGADLLVRNGKIVTDATARASQDTSIHGFKKAFRQDETAALQRADEIIKNTYRTLMTRGQKGCYVFSEDGETREYFRSLIASASSSDFPVANDKAMSYAGLDAPILDGKPISIEAANAVPVFDMHAAAGAFSEEQLPEDSDYVVLPDHFRARKGMFVAKVVGESMNRRIRSNSWCVFAHNPGGTRNGKVVLVAAPGLADPDTGERYTIKLYFSEKTYDEDGNVCNRHVVLRPDSFSDAFEAMVLDEDSGQGMRVIGEYLATL